MQPVSLLRVYHWPGADAADFIARGEEVDLMLLDIRMPGKSGLDVVKEATVRPRYPIVAMTGHVDIEAQDEFRCVDQLPGLTLQTL